MANDTQTPGVRAGRLPADRYAANFADLYPPYSAHEAVVAADRCYFCHDAPCVTACPTSIDIPMFIREIQVGQPGASAKTIFDQNILGGMCARVCPVETLCEEACVREVAEGKPVTIGRLQRYATDTLMAAGVHPYVRAAPTGKTVAIAGAGPAGLAAAHRLAMKGHEAVVFDPRPKPGGLNEYGIAAYKTPGDFAQEEIDWLLQIGGIRLETGRALGADLTLEMLRGGYDAVVLAIGLAGVNALSVPGRGLAHVEDAVDFIARLRQAPDKAALEIGRNVVVIGGGMTAIDAAVQSRKLGAETVTLVYRRGQAAMGASPFEQDLAKAAGVRVIHGAAPKRLLGEGAVSGIEFDYMDLAAERLVPTGETFRLDADQVFIAIGQRLEGQPEDLALAGGKIAVSGAGRTSIPGVWAAGDCTPEGEDLTVTAVAQGRDAAEDIHRHLMG